MGNEHTRAHTTQDGSSDTDRPGTLPTWHTDGPVRLALTRELSTFVHCMIKLCKLDNNFNL